LAEGPASSHDSAAYRRQLTIDTKSCRTEMLGDLTANYNGIPRKGEQVYVPKDAVERVREQSMDFEGLLKHVEPVHWNHI
jgi:hypothetical protein